MSARSFGFAIFTVLIAGCGGAFAPAGVPNGGAPAVEAPDVAVLPLAKVRRQHVYWTLFAGAKYPQIQMAAVPLRSKSKSRSVNNGSKNDLLYTSGMAVDRAGHLWVLSFGQYHGNPTTAVVFKLPIKPASNPLYTFVLSGTSASNALAFDASGNLWVTSPGNDSAMQYSGPFTKSGTLTPAITLSATGFATWGVAVDKHANVYFSNSTSTGTDSIAVVKPPYSGSPYFLNGVSKPAGLAFDKAGNLYASTCGGCTASATAAVVRYDSNGLKSGDSPSIVDPTGLPASSYLASFAFTAKGDLYAANCGNSGSAGVDVYPTSEKAFTAHLAPSVEYKDSAMSAAGCAWGIAVR